MTEPKVYGEEQLDLAQVWVGIVCSHCGGRYGRPLGELAERCLDCGKVGYEARKERPDG